MDKSDKLLLIITAVGLLLISLCYRLLGTYWRLKNIPGPFWARFTNFQRVLWVNTGRAHEIHQAVHRKYGNLVRFGPNMVSIADPAAIPTVYPTRPGFPKVCLSFSPTQQLWEAVPG